METSDALNMIKALERIAGSLERLEEGLLPTVEDMQSSVDLVLIEILKTVKLSLEKPTYTLMELRNPHTCKEVTDWSKG